LEHHRAATDRRVCQLLSPSSKTEVRDELRKNVVSVGGIPRRSRGCRNPGRTDAGRRRFIIRDRCGSPERLRHVATNKVARTLSVQTKGSNRLKFTPDGKLVLISDNPGGELVVLDAVAGKVIKRLKIGRTTTGIQIVPDGSRAYVAAEGDDNVAVIDLRTLEITNRLIFPTRSRPDGMAWGQ